MLRRSLARVARLWRERTGAVFDRAPLPEAFDAIYRDRVWAGESEMLSGPGSYGPPATRYAAFVREFIARTGARSLVDVGCGDFNVGRQIAPALERYIGVDVSRTIIERNRALGAPAHCRFEVADACTDPLPGADIITVRQVFQHLTNVEIALALVNIEAADPRYVLVTEHLPAPARMKAPNRDLPSHGSGTRLAMRSGVVLDAPPFSRACTEVWSLPLGEGAAGRRERLVTVLLERAG